MPNDWKAEPESSHALRLRCARRLLMSDAASSPPASAAAASVAHSALESFARWTRMPAASASAATRSRRSGWLRRSASVLSSLGMETASR